MVVEKRSFYKIKIHQLCCTNRNFPRTNTPINQQILTTDGGRYSNPDSRYRPDRFRIRFCKSRQCSSDQAYAKGYLNHAATLFLSETDPDAPTPMEEAASSITALLASASGDTSKENCGKIQQLVDGWVASLEAANAAAGRSRMTTAPRTKKLDAVFQVGAQRNMSSTMGLATGMVDLESANTKKVESRVDRKKLEKAERKIAAKQDRKTMKNVQYEASRLLDQPTEAESYEEFYMKVNPLQLGADQAKSKDIKVESTDVSIGGKRILTDTTLTMAFGRRYGLVGQNGIGKSTLLRALSRRELAIPTHISILHVEQEVCLTLFKTSADFRSLAMTRPLFRQC